METNENAGIIGVWVKSYDVYTRLSETHGADLDAARKDFYSRIADGRTEFAQLGANTVEGAIVLGEYHRHG